MIPDDERRAALRRAKAFAHVGARECDDILRTVRERRLATGEALCREGEAGDTMGVVVAGSLQVRVSRPDSEAAELGVVGVGDLYGELACLDPAPRSATLIALEPTTVFELGRDALTALRRASPRAASIVVGAAMREATRRILALEERIERELAVPALAEASEGAGAAASPDEGAPKRRSGFWGFFDRHRGSL